MKPLVTDHGWVLAPDRCASNPSANVTEYACSSTLSVSRSDPDIPVNGGMNTPDNLVWSCLWCNTWVIERTPGSTDRGAIR